MNPYDRVTTVAARRVRCGVTPGLVLALVACSVGTAAGDAPAPAPATAEPAGATAPAPAAPRTYHLYVGADIDVPKGDTFFRMQRFTNYAAEIRVEGHVQRLPIRGMGSMRVGRDMKLSPDLATITDVRVERAYTAAQDPFRKWASSGLTPAADTRTTMERNPNIPQPSRGPGGAGTPDLRFEILEPTTSETFSNAGNNMTDTPQFVNRSELEKGRQLFDAIEADFTISSATELHDCYLLLICDFTDDEEAGMLRRWMHLKTIGGISSTPRKVHVFDGGLPPGFKLEAHEFHIYAAGREIATNLSDKRIELSEDEAFTFMNLQYIGAHRGETLPPVLAWSDVPEDLADRLPPDVLRWPIHVRVDADGRVVGIAADEEGKRGAPRRVVDAVRTFRFNPALEGGRPVPGRVVLRIADFLPPLPE